MKPNLILVNNVEINVYKNLKKYFVTENNNQFLAINEIVPEDVNDDPELADPQIMEAKNIVPGRFLTYYF